MSPIATVVIPTFDHGPLLAYALKSAQRQSLRDIEILVIGDGAPDLIRKLVTTVQNQDSRVIFFDNPKGAGRGEAYRHQALQSAKGYIVCYLSDDDLWLPNHVELMANCLKNCDLAASYGAYLAPLAPVTEASFLLYDITHPYFVNYLQKKTNSLLPLSCVAHRMSTYFKLPEGWSPAPKKIPSDLFMWRKFLAHENIRTGMVFEPTCLHFASAQRSGIALEDRYAELRKMWRNIATRPGAAAVQRQLRDTLLQLMAHYSVKSKPAMISRARAQRHLRKPALLRRSLMKPFSEKS